MGPVTDHVCTYRPVSFNIYTIMYISIIAVVVGGIYDGILELLFRIAFAPLIQNESVTMGVIKEFARKSIARLSINSVTPIVKKDDSDAAVVKRATEIQVAAANSNPRHRRMSTNTIAVTDDMLNRRNSLAALALTAAPAMHKELYRRNSVRNSLRMSISGAINIAGGFRFALQPLYDYDEFIGDINCQYNMFKTERERSDFLRVWRLPPSDIIEDTVVSPDAGTGMDTGTGAAAVERSCVIPPKTEERIRKYLAELKLESASKFSELQGALDSQIAVETIRLFVLGKDTDAARIFLVKSEEDSGQVFEVSYDTRNASVAVLALLNMASIGYVLWQASIHELRWQVAFIIASILHCFFAITLMEASAVLFCNFAVPVQVSEDIQKAYELILKLSRQFSESATNPAPINPYAAPVVMDAPGYLFLSFKVAQKNTRMLESLIILSHDSYFPGSIARRWDPSVCDEFDTTGLSTQEAFRVKWNQYNQMMDFGVMMKYFGSFQMKNQLVITKIVQTVFYCILLLFALLFSTNFLLTEILVPLFVFIALSLYYNKYLDELTVVKAFKSRYTIVPDNAVSTVEEVVDRPVYDEEWLSQFHHSDSSSSSSSESSSGSSDSDSDSNSDSDSDSDSSSYESESSLSTHGRIHHEDILLSEEESDSESDPDEASLQHGSTSIYRYQGSLLDSHVDENNESDSESESGSVSESEWNSTGVGTAVGVVEKSISTVQQEDSCESLEDDSVAPPIVTIVTPIRKDLATVPGVGTSVGFTSPRVIRNPELNPRIGVPIPVLNQIHSGIAIEHNTPLSPSTRPKTYSQSKPQPYSHSDISLSDDSSGSSDSGSSETSGDDDEDDEENSGSSYGSTGSSGAGGSVDVDTGVGVVDTIGTNITSSLGYSNNHREDGSLGGEPDLDVSYVDNV